MYTSRSGHRVAAASAAAARDDARHASARLARSRAGESGSFPPVGAASSSAKELTAAGDDDEACYREDARLLVARGCLGRTKRPREGGTHVAPRYIPSQSTRR